MRGSLPADEPARNDSQAKVRLLKVLNRSLDAVCAEAQWIVVPDLTSPGLWSAVTAPEIVHLRTGSGERLPLRSTIRFTYVDHPDRRRERKASTREYSHTVWCDPSLGPQLYSWEWNSADGRYPHVHLRRGHHDYKGLHRLHVPTGRVFFESVLLFLIQDHGVKPCREDWRDVLDDSLQRVSIYSSWGGGIAPQ